MICPVVGNVQSVSWESLTKRYEDLIFTHAHTHSHTLAFSELHCSLVLLVLQFELTVVCDMNQTSLFMFLCIASVYQISCIHAGESIKCFFQPQVNINVSILSKNQVPLQFTITNVLLQYHHMIVNMDRLQQNIWAAAVCYQTVKVPPDPKSISRQHIYHFKYTQMLHSALNKSSLFMFVKQISSTLL